MYHYHNYNYIYLLLEHHYLFFGRYHNKIHNIFYHYHTKNKNYMDNLFLCFFLKQISIYDLLHCYYHHCFSIFFIFRPKKLCKYKISILSLIYIFNILIFLFYHLKIYYLYDNFYYKEFCYLYTN